MKRLVISVVLVITIIFTWLQAASVDGTSSTQYKSTVQVFRAGVDYVRGFARLGNGFAVSPRGSAFMDTNISVSGQMDLGETGTLVLLNNLYFERNITLTSSGNIKGKATVSGDAKTIFLGGDMTIASDSYKRILHITGDWCNSGTSGDLIIDGRGHTLDIQDRAQIFVDTNITLTLRNMTIRTGPKSLNTPAIQLAAQGSKLTLDNVMFDLGADFHFINGQVFIHNEVAVTGTSAFVYQSPVPSYITSGATWSFEQGTTFSVAPSTYTDLPYTAGTATSNNFIVLADSSSALYLNSCSFKTTYTGLRLTNGMVLVDNRVAIDTQAGMELATTGTSSIGYLGGAISSSYPYSMTWSPDGRYMAVVCQTGNWLRVYRFNGASAPVEIGSGSPASATTNPWGVSWSPDGRYLAVACNDNNRLRIYRFNGSSVPVEIGSGVAANSEPHAVSWSPDGRYLAVACFTGSVLRIYRFDGLSVPVEVGSGVSAGSNPYSIAWSPDGRYVALTCITGDWLRVYRFNGRSVPTEVGSTAPASASTYPFSVAWSPDGRYLAVACQGTSLVRVYRFNGSSAPTEIGSGANATSYPYSVAWSPNGGYLVAGCDSGNWLRIYRFNPSLGAVEIVTGAAIAPWNPRSVTWSPDGGFVAAVCPGNNVLRVFRCNYYYTGQPNQAFTSSLIFGNSAKGSSCNANVRVLPGASVALQGKVTDDSA